MLIWLSFQWLCPIQLVLAATLAYLEHLFLRWPLPMVLVHAFRIRSRVGRHLGNAPESWLENLHLLMVVVLMPINNGHTESFWSLEWFFLCLLVVVVFCFFWQHWICFEDFQLWHRSACKPINVSLKKREWMNLESVQCVQREILIDREEHFFIVFDCLAGELKAKVPIRCEQGFVWRRFFYLFFFFDRVWFPSAYSHLS